MMMTVKHKKIKRTNHKVKDVQHKHLHHSDCSLLLNHEQQQITDLCRLAMTAVMSHNTSNVDDDILNKQHLHMIKAMLKSRLMNIIDCHDDDMISKCMQVVNLTVKEHRIPVAVSFAQQYYSECAPHHHCVSILSAGSS